VPSGDRLFVYSLSESNTNQTRFILPPKKEIKLSWVQAPKASAKWKENNVEKTRKVEPFYWGSRNFLRKLAIGKAVELDIVSTPDKDKDNKDSKKRDIPRVLANVTLKDSDGSVVNLSQRIVQEGWATVATPKNPERTPEALKALIEAQDNAKKQKKGIFFSR